MKVLALRGGRAIVLTAAVLGCLAAPAAAAPQPFTLVSPAAGASLATLTPSLTWNATTAPSGIQAYVVVIDNVEVAEVDPAGCGTTCTYVSPALSEDGHVWRVIAVDNDDVELSSDTRSFVLDVTPPPPVTITKSSVSSVEWSGSDPGFGGVFEVRQNGIVVADVTTGSHSFEKASLSIDTTWEIVAVDKAGNRSGTATSVVLVRTKPTLTASTTTPWIGQPVSITAAFPPAVSVAGASFTWWFARGSVGGIPMTELEPRQSTDTTTVSVRFSSAGRQAVGLISALVGRASSTGTVELTVQAPTGEPGVTIAGGAGFTNRRRVPLSLTWPTDATAISLSNGEPMSSATSVPLVSKAMWTLSGTGHDGRASAVQEQVTRYGSGATTASDTIILDLERPTVTSAIVEHGRLRLKAYDKVSGLATVQTATQRAHPGKATRFRSVAPVTTATWVRVTDKAGNRSRWTHIAR